MLLVISVCGQAQCIQSAPLQPVPIGMGQFFPGHSPSKPFQKSRLITVSFPPAKSHSEECEIQLLSAQLLYLR